MADISVKYRVSSCGHTKGLFIIHTIFLCYHHCSCAIEAVNSYFLISSFKTYTSLPQNFGYFLAKCQSILLFATRKNGSLILMPVDIKNINRR